MNVSGKVSPRAMVPATAVAAVALSILSCLCGALIVPKGGGTPEVATQLVTVEVTRQVEVTRLAQVVVTATGTVTPRFTPTDTLTPTITITPSNTFTPSKTPTITPTPNVARTQTAEALLLMTAAKTDGAYLVNVDIAPGTWRSLQGWTDSACYWARLDKNQNILNNYFGASGGAVTIRASDFEFQSTGCGSWEYLGP